MRYIYIYIYIYSKFDRTKISKKIKNIFVVGNAYFQLNLWSIIWKKGTACLKRTAIYTNKCYSKPWHLSGDVTDLNDLYQTSPRRMIVWEICLRQMGNLRPDGSRKGRPRTTLTRSVENDLAPLNIDLDSAWRKKPDRTGWRRLVTTAAIRRGAVWFQFQNLNQFQFQ